MIAAPLHQRSDGRGKSLGRGDYRLSTIDNRLPSQPKHPRVSDFPLLLSDSRLRLQNATNLDTQYGVVHGPVED